MVAAAGPVDPGVMITAIRRIEERITWVAVLAPLPYSLQRLIWAVGIPLGIHPDGLHGMLQSPGLGSLGLLGLVMACEGTAAFTYAFVLCERRMPAWLVVAPLLAPIGILATFNQWSLQYVVDGFTMPSEVAESIPPWSFWAQVAIFWIWGVSLAIATGAYVVRRTRSTLAGGSQRRY
jgi:hypothetical protein